MGCAKLAGLEQAEVVRIKKGNEQLWLALELITLFEVTLWRCYTAASTSHIR